MAYFDESANPFSHKKLKIINRSNGENHIVVVLNLKIVKIKEISKGENLSEASKDERIETLPNYLYWEQSTILIEPIVPINIGKEDSQHILTIVASLSKSEREEFI